jgi:hypothetical protein
MEPLSTTAIITIVTAVSGIIVGLTEIIRYLVGYILKKKSDGDDVSQKRKLAEIHCQTRSIWEITGQKDKDGIPMCYFPRSYNDVYKNILELQQKLVERMTEMTYEQKRIAQLLDRMERRYDVVQQ